MSAVHAAAAVFLCTEAPTFFEYLTPSSERLPCTPAPGGVSSEESQNIKPVSLSAESVSGYTNQVCRPDPLRQSSKSRSESVCAIGQIKRDHWLSLMAAVPFYIWLIIQFCTSSAWWWALSASAWEMLSSRLWSAVLCCCSLPRACSSCWVRDWHILSSSSTRACSPERSDRSFSNSSFSLWRERI